MTSDLPFVPGRELAKVLARFFEPAVRSSFPGMPIAIAFVGPGSDVAGFDTARSRDHDWGPRLTLFTPPEHRQIVATRIDAEPGLFLPSEVLGYPTRFSMHDDGTALVDGDGMLHRINVTTLGELISSSLLIKDIGEMDDADWLSTPMQTLFELTAGGVFVDDVGDLTCLREQISFYPDHIWRYQLAGLWMRVSQVQPFIGRCFETNDVAGGIVIAQSVVRDLMRIGLLQSRSYVPYSKWLGTAFARTQIGTAVRHHLLVASAGVDDFPILESSINEAGGALIRQLNALQLIAPESAAPHQFHSRPFMVLPAERIAIALKDAVRGTGLDRFETILGGIDMISDSTDALGSAEYRRAIRSMFAP